MSSSHPYSAPTFSTAKPKSKGVDHATQMAALRRVDKISRLMDTAFKVPIIGRRVGWDGIIGLVPGVGDTITAAISAYPIVEALRMGAPRTLALRMAANVGVDWLVGSVPILGDFFDFAFRANIRNAALLRRWLEKA
ncbi:MAG: DUF4112 domain-containing protein [Verrucomicrobiota bacterium JB022]|nr:DUF4112 domain-containing protein [Verrucomicrobiota bacterium JB022]